MNPDTGLSDKQVQVKVHVYLSSQTGRSQNKQTPLKEGVRQRSRGPTAGQPGRTKGWNNKLEGQQAI